MIVVDLAPRRSCSPCSPWPSPPARSPSPLVLIAMFCLGTAEVFADNASHALLPTLLHRDDLGIGNARVMFGFGTLNQLAGPPLGAALFVVGAAWPFAAQVLLVVLGAGWSPGSCCPGRSATARRAPAHPAATSPRASAGPTSTRPVRTLVLTIFTFNITFGAAPWSVLVLYATQRLGIGAVGFGLLTTVSAVGGIIGTLAYGRHHPAREPGRHHADRAGHRDRHPSGPGHHDRAVGRRW